MDMKKHDILNIVSNIQNAAELALIHSERKDLEKHAETYNLIIRYCKQITELLEDV